MDCYSLNAISSPEPAVILVSNNKSDFKVHDRTATCDSKLRVVVGDQIMQGKTVQEIRDKCKTMVREGLFQFSVSLCHATLRCQLTERGPEDYAWWTI